MGKQVKITLPKLGESIVEARVLQWFKKVGERVALDEPLLEVSTDKVNSEIPSSVAGILEEIYAHPDQEVQVGEVLATISVQDHASEQTLTHDTHGVVLDCVGSCEDKRTSPSEPLMTPAVCELLKEKGIPLSEVDRIPRTGANGRLTRKDVELYRVQEQSLERVKMSGLRRAIAENMVKSFYAAPHASLVSEVDVTRLVKTIKERKEQGLERWTITTFVAQAIARAVAAYPLINSCLEEDTIVLRRFVNLGIAVSIDQGVVVPVIRGCEQLDLPEIARQIAGLAEKARTNTLAPEDVTGGTITLTNFGMAGVQIGIPIIRYPEVAIIGLGSIHKKVVVTSDDAFAIRSVMMVSLTFDHRVLDGLYGCGFLNEIKNRLEQDS